MDDRVQDAYVHGSRQHGLVTFQQCIDTGAKRNGVSRLAARGQVRRVRHGVYAFAGSPTSWEQELLGAVLSAGDGAAASHSSAAALWGFRHLPYLTFELTISRSRRVRLSGVSVHRSTSFGTSDVTRRNRVPVTTFERTLIDCTAVLSEFQLSANLDDGLRRRVASLRKLRECAQRLEAGPGRRLSVVRSLLAARPNRFDPGGSAQERRVLDVLTAAGLPAPVQQHRVAVNGKTYFLDYAYPKQRVFIEYYGSAWHGTPSAVVYDSDRISDLTTLRWQPLIFTEATPDRVIVERTATVLALAA
jgi:hypothetical protein